MTITCSHDDSDFIDTGNVYTEATCTTNGRKQQCPYCGITTRITIPALGHDYDSGTWVTNDTQHWKQCSRCDSTDTPENHVFNGLVCETCGYEKAQVITVTIIWSGLAFTYTDGLWDPETHDYTDGQWAANDPDGDKITVENTGKTEVSVEFVYAIIAAVPESLALQSGHRHTACDRGCGHRAVRQLGSRQPGNDSGFGGGSAPIQPLTDTAASLSFPHSGLPSATHDPPLSFSKGAKEAALRRCFFCFQ